MIYRYSYIVVVCVLEGTFSVEYSVWRILKKCFVILSRVVTSHIVEKSKCTLAVTNSFAQRVHLVLHNKVLPSFAKTDHNALPL